MNQDNATNKIETQVGEREIVITRVFDAPRDLVIEFSRFKNLIYL